MDRTVISPPHQGDARDPPRAESIGLSVRDLSVSLGGRDVISNVNLEIRSPGIVVVGSAGCGKTTLLKALCGLVEIRGTIAVDGQPLPSEGIALDEARRAFGFVFQSDALFDDRSVLSNVMFPLLRRGTDETEALREARKVLRSVGLSDAEASLPEQLSGGMKKRLGIARAIVARPPILLADDPIAGLDPGTSGRIVDLLSRGAALKVVAASDPLPFAKMCPQLVGLDRLGRVAMEGPTLELARSPLLEKLFLDAEVVAPERPGIAVERPA
jgi:phospholipid/cholesterol/gamma-HCH transport system ATP-binding protein